MCFFVFFLGTTMDVMLVNRNPCPAPVINAEYSQGLTGRFHVLGWIEIGAHETAFKAFDRFAGLRTIVLGEGL